MKKILSIALLGFAIAFAGCDNAESTDGSANNTDQMANNASGENGGDANADGASDGGSDANAEVNADVPRPQPNDDEINVDVPAGSSVLIRLEDMAYDEAYEIDDFKSRLNVDLQGFNDVMLAQSPMFAMVDGYLVAKARSEGEDGLKVAFMVADPNKDAVFAGIWDDDDRKVTYYQDKPGLEKPSLLVNWANDVK